MQLVSDGNVVRWRRETTAAASSYNGVGRDSHVISAVNSGSDGKSNCHFMYMGPCIVNRI